VVAAPPRHPCALILLLIVAAMATMVGQQVAPPTEPRIRALLREAESEARDDPSGILLGLDRRFRAEWGEFESFPLSIVKSEDLGITLTTPFMGFRRTVADHLRIKRPLREVAWVDAAVISVSPARTSAPDITNIRLARNGAAVQPLKNGLRPMTFTSGRGDSAVLHAGDVLFPMSAFAPGATVTITAEAREREPFVLTLQDAELGQLK
jgi:hypothetical protein